MFITGRGKLMRILLIVLLSLTLSGLHVKPSYGASPWPMFMHDARHSGRSEYVIPDKISIQWFSDFAVQEITGMSISLDGNIIYAGSKDHKVYAIDASDGSVIKAGFSLPSDWR